MGLTFIQKQHKSQLTLTHTIQSQNSKSTLEHSELQKASKNIVAYENFPRN